MRAGVPGLARGDCTEFNSVVLARIIHDGSSPFDLLRVPSPAEGRNRRDARRDRHAEPQETEAYLKQYVEVVRGEPVWPPKTRGHACRSGVSAVAVEAFMNNAGWVESSQYEGIRQLCVSTVGTVC